MAELKVTDNHVFFWGSFLSNFEPCTIKYNPESDEPDLKFRSSEQLFMYFKAWHFHDEESMTKILAVETPKEAKKLGRKVRGFDEDEWSRVRAHYMYISVYEKFAQNPTLLNKLMSQKFDNKTFVEASPYDRIWGIGMGMDDPGVDDESNWMGLNLLGNTINAVRKTYISSYSDPKII